MTAETPTSAPEEIRELRDRREEILDTLAHTASDDPEVPRLCGLAGELSYRLLLLDGPEEHLPLAAEAFGHAFRAPGDDGDWAAWRILYGHVRAFQYDSEPDPGLLDAMWELLRDGVAGLPAGDDDYDLVHDLGRQLLASCAKQRYLACEEAVERRLELLDEALRLYADAAATVEPGSEDAVELDVSRGYLYLDRVELSSEPADAEAAARHYGAALAAEPLGGDLPLLRHSHGLALMTHGRMTRDRDELELAREAFGTALLEARQREGEPPTWAWEAEIRSAFVRTLIWATWKDQAQAAAAEVELAGLLADPADVDRLPPVYLDCFGRLLFERGGVRRDVTVQDRGIALIRKSLDEWEADRDGPVSTTALMLAVFQQSRYQEDPEERRLRDVAEAAALVLADEEFDDQLRQMARMMGSWAWFTLEDTGATGAEPPAGMGADEARQAYVDMLRDLEQGRGFLDFSGTSDDFPGIFKGFGGLDRLAEGFDQGFARYRALEEGAGRAFFALALLSHTMLLDPHGTHVAAEQKEELIDCVLAHGQDDPEWQRKAHAVVAQTRLRDELAGNGRGMDTVLDHLARAEAIGGDEQLGHGIDLARAAATTHRGQTAGTGDDVEAGAAMWRKLRESPQLSPHMRQVLDAQQSALDAQAAAQRGDLAGTDRHLAELLAVHADLDPEDPARIELWTHLENARSARDRLAGLLGAPPAPPLVGRPSLFQLRRAAKQLPRDHRAWVLGDNGITRFIRAGEKRDAEMLAEAMELLQEAYDLVDEGSDSRLRYAHCLGSGHCALAEMHRLPSVRTRHLTRGITMLEESLRMCGGPEHRLYAACGLALGRAYRVRGELRRDDRGAGRRTGLDALRGHAWAALLQSGTEHAAHAVREATDTAFEVAGWCLRDNAPEDAVRALDACRGLVLHAATTSRTVPERLVAAGRGDLADEWHAAGLGSTPADPLTALRAAVTVPSSLRRRVLAALTGAHSVQDRLLDPPSPEEIGEALRTLRKDALVYLVPAGEDTPGSAVVVTSRGDVHSVPLPTLKADAAALREYAQPRGGGTDRDMGPVPGHAAAAGPSLRQRLDRLCGWAWYAGMRPLLDMFDTRTGRVPRLVFVPMDTLSLVPWHAAWGTGPDDERRYALQEAEISYAASARLLCDVAARPAVTHSGPALVVGNPTGDLRYAGEEADAVQRAFYPRGRFLGRRETGEADGPGTPGEVLEWLTRAASGGETDVAEETAVEEEAGEERDRDAPRDGAVLHLACHAAIARDTRRTSHLALHGGELAAEELTEAVGGAGRGRLGIVLLAACRSHVSGRGYNEAYSLATAFLVAGARSVVGSLWPVPDDATSVLMFLTHHYLRTGNEPPARALRRAQLWMLDPARELPADLPARLAERVPHIDPDDLSAWAGFTHLGQ